MKILAMLLLMVFSMALAILMMIHGWGLTPASWGWIIGGTILQMTIVGVQTGLAKE